MTITRDQLPDPLETKRFKRKAENTMRTFKSGATRDNDDNKLDFDGFLCPLALTRYAEYLHLHRTQADGKKRTSDNWQSGIPDTVYVKSLFRHFMDLWTMHRGYVVTDRKDGHVIDDEEALCAIIFNAFGLLHETLIDKRTPPSPAEAATDVQVEAAADSREIAAAGAVTLPSADYTHGEF